MKALQSLGGVKSVNIDESGLSIEINPDQNEIRDQIVEVAVQQKMGVLEFVADKLSLEEVFLSLTTQESTEGVQS
jgi:hypothetical protein